MLVGHVAVGLAGKRLVPQVSLGTLVLAALLADLLWGGFLVTESNRWRLSAGAPG